MVDFTSSLYLGMRHPSGSLSPWAQLTTGVPAALAEPAIVKAVTRQIASLQGSERTTLGPSSLHLFWDWFGLFEDEQAAVYMDAAVYPAAQWGAERASGRGVPVYRFPHGDADSLRRLLRQGKHRLPIVVCDGLCTACGCVTPIADYLDSIRQAGGLLVLDDTQALGVLGASADGRLPYGRGGGGSFRHQAITGQDIVVISSLAKAFGAPLAALSGSRRMVEHFETRSETRLHSSPPSNADLRAAQHALKLNAERGDGLRSRLAQRVRCFRGGLAVLGLGAAGGLFPVQTLETFAGADASRLYGRLLAGGIQPILRKGCDDRGPRISFVITARHRPEEIDRAIEVLAKAI